MKNPPEPCIPFSECWCETRPNNPHCAQSVPIDTYIPFVLILTVVVAYYKFKKIN